MNQIESLKILETAISDVGYWNWWDTLLPDVAQLEFGGIQLYQANEHPENPPFSTIALRFSSLRSFCFLTKNRNHVSEDWYKLLQQDLMEPPACDNEYFTLTDKALMKKALSFAESTIKIAGEYPDSHGFWQGKYKLVFWARDYGCAVSADKINLICHSGEISIDEVFIRYKEWWEYWRKYWDFKNTSHPMPQDYACEVTIPMKR